MTALPTLPPLALGSPAEIEAFIMSADATLAPLAASIPAGSPLAPLANIINTMHGVLVPFFKVINQFDILSQQQQPATPGAPATAAPGRQFVGQLLGQIISTLHSPTASPSGGVGQIVSQLLSSIAKPPAPTA